MKVFAVVILLGALAIGCQSIPGLRAIPNPVVDVFCFETGGGAKEFMEKIPTIGGAIVGAVGICVPEKEVSVETPEEKGE